MINEIPNGLTVNKMAELVENCSNKTFPKVDFINGFCMMIRREVIDKIGYMDEINFCLELQKNY